MSVRVVVIGAGVGGLSAALRVARAGCAVRLLEARAGTGGLASALVAGSFRFDGGPYVLLDRPGLAWALAALGLDVQDLALRRVEDVYEVAADADPIVRLHADLETTAAGFEREWPGSGARYRAFVARAGAAWARLQPVLLRAQPRPLDVLRAGAWRDLGFLLRPLQDVLDASGLPAPVRRGLAIWTHVAGQPARDAPGPMAFVPALIHTAGAYYPCGGVGAIPALLEAAARQAGVAIETGVAVRRICVTGDRAVGVEMDSGAVVPADAVMSDVGLATYLDLLDRPPAALVARLRCLPLQSPGVGAYLAVRGRPRPPYLHFRVAGDGGRCRLFVVTPIADPSAGSDGWWPARLVAPAGAEMPAPDQLDRLLEESWWREGVDEVRVLARRVPADWGREFRLHADAMNPVMTARLMRSGRLAHRSPWIRGLYLAGSATHPGQWVSFCAISGILAADALRSDLA